MNKDLHYMKIAYMQAKKAYANGEIPVGCVIVCDDKVVAKGHNLRETQKSVIGHAEIVTIVKACKKMQAKFLDNMTMYITLEPCLMCSGAIMQARISRVVYGAKEPKFGCATSLGNVFADYKANHSVEVTGGVMEYEISQMMKSFFQELRQSKQNS